MSDHNKIYWLLNDIAMPLFSTNYLKIMYVDDEGSLDPNSDSDTITAWGGTLRCHVSAI